MRSSRTTISFNPIVTAYLCKQASKEDTSLQTESCSQWNHDQSFSPRFFFPPSSNGSSPSKEDLSRTRETLLYDRCQAEVQAGEKLGTTRNSARVRGCRWEAGTCDNFPSYHQMPWAIYFTLHPFLYPRSALLFPTPFVFLSHFSFSHCSWFFKSFVSFIYFFFDLLFRSSLYLIEDYSVHFHSIWLYLFFCF